MAGLFDFASAAGPALSNFNTTGQNIIRLDELARHTRQTESMAMEDLNLRKQRQVMDAKQFELLRAKTEQEIKKQAFTIRQAEEEEKRLGQPKNFMLDPIVLNMDQQSQSTFLQHMLANGHMNESGLGTVRSWEMGRGEMDKDRAFIDAMAKSALPALQQKAIEDYGAYRKAKESNADPEKLAKLQEQAQGSRVKAESSQKSFEDKFKRFDEQEQMEGLLGKMKSAPEWNSLPNQVKFALENTAKVGDKKTFDTILQKVAENATKPQRKIERTVDLGDKVEYHYADGTVETKPKGRSPNALAVTEGNIEATAQLLAEGKLNASDISKRGGPGVVDRVYKRAREINPDFDPRGTQGENAAYQATISMQEKQIGQMGSFVKNMEKQVGRVKEISKELASFDARLLNLPLRAIRGRISGSANQAKYDMYITEIENEIGKLATGSAASISELSINAQQKWEKIHDKNLSIKDMIALLNETKHAGKLRMDSVMEQLRETKERRVKSRNSGVTPKPTEPSSSVPKPQTIKLKSGRVITVED